MNFLQGIGSSIYGIAEHVYCDNFVCAGDDNFDECHESCSQRVPLALGLLVIVVGNVVGIIFMRRETNRMRHELQNLKAKEVFLQMEIDMLTQKLGKRANTLPQSNDKDA